MSLVTDRNGQVEMFIKEMNLLCNAIEDPEMKKLNSESSDTAIYFVEKFLRRRNSLIEEKRLKPCMERLKNICLEKSLGDRSALINRFIRPIITLRDPNGPLTHSMGFLPPRSVHSASFVSRDFLKASDLQMLSRINKGVRAKDLGLTEGSLLRSLKRNPGVNITCLNIDSLAITDIVSLLDLCPNLEVLSVRNCGISPLAARNLADHRSIQNLRSLDLGRNGIEDKGAKAIAESDHMKNLTFLDLAWTEIGVEGAKAVANSANMRNLTSLSLSFNHMGDEGAKAIAGSDNIRNLTFLNFSYNAIGAEGAAALRRLEARGVPCRCLYRIF